MDSIIYNFIYTHCLRLGSTFGYGALEGTIMYFICICGPVVAILEKRRNK